MSEKTSTDESDVTDRDTADGGASVTVANGLIAVVRFKSMAGFIIIASDSLIGRIGFTGDDCTLSTRTGAGGGATTTDGTTATDSTGADGDGGGEQVVQQLVLQHQVRHRLDVCRQPEVLVVVACTPFRQW